jgi:ribosomal protein L1
MKKLALKNLKYDDELLGIRKLNAFTVSEYRQNMRCGAKFPPIIVTQDKVIVSGNHRHAALIQEFGPDHVTEVIVKTYKNRLEILQDFIKENISHGKKFAEIEKRAATLKLIEHDMKSEAIAQLFNLPVKKIIELAETSVFVIGGGGEQETKAIKNGIEHLIGQTMDKDQYQEHMARDVGISCSRQAQQLTRWIVNGWINRENKNDMESLSGLYGALDGFLKDQKQAA